LDDLRCRADDICKRSQLLLQREYRRANHWQASATMARVDAALISLPETRAKMLAIADKYDRLAAVGEDLYARYREPNSSFQATDSVADPASGRLRILKTAVPSLKRVAMLCGPNSLNMQWRYEPSLETATELGMSVQLLGVTDLTISTGHSPRWSARCRRASSWRQTFSATSIANACISSVERTNYRRS
jgi:hypothetical protein